MGKIFGETMLEYYNQVLKFKGMQQEFKEQLNYDQLVITPNQRALSTNIVRNQEQNNNNNIEKQKKKQNKKKRRKIKQISSRQSDQVNTLNPDCNIQNPTESQKLQFDKFSYLAHFKGLINQINVKNAEQSRAVKLEEDLSNSDGSDCESSSEDLNEKEFKMLQQKITTQCKKFEETMYTENWNSKIQFNSISPLRNQQTQKHQQRDQKSKTPGPNLKNIKHKIQIGELLPPKPQVITPIQVDVPTKINYDQDIKVPSHVVQMKRLYQQRKIYHILPALQPSESEQQQSSNIAQVNFMDMCLIPRTTNNNDNSNTFKPKSKNITINNTYKIKNNKLQRLEKQLKMPHSLTDNNNKNQDFQKKKIRQTKKVKSIINSEPKSQQKEEASDQKLRNQVYGYQNQQLSQISKFTTIQSNKKSYL